ncbi:MAG: hypothetical protein ACQES1_02975 [Bacteroidota bacterium]
MIKKNENKKITFHVGLPRTASTFLQSRVFPVFRGIEYVKKHDFRKHDAIIANADKPVLLSTEMDLGKGRRNSKALYAITEKYPHVRLILVLRRHDKWIASKYKYFIRKNGTLSFHDFFNLQPDDGFFRTEHLKYRKIIDDLETLCESRPLVIFQEELINAPEKIIQLMADYCGAEVNVKDIKLNRVNYAFSEKQLRLLLKFNRRFYFDKEKHGRFRKKMRAAMIHGLAFLAQIFVVSSGKEKALIPDDDLKQIREAFRDDWEACVEYALQDRKLYIE